MIDKAANKNFKAKIQSCLHRSDRTSAAKESYTNSEITIVAKDREKTGQHPRHGTEETSALGRVVVVGDILDDIEHESGDIGGGRSIGSYVVVLWFI
ncbi:hypothetical protein BBP40_007410 [Aspergillus hancockii]|nr:hypothetical protein BBP40_007410 [Aspergillus hancockii]